MFSSLYFLSIFSVSVFACSKIHLLNSFRHCVPATFIPIIVEDNKINNTSTTSSEICFSVTTEEADNTLEDFSRIMLLMA